MAGHCWSRGPAIWSQSAHGGSWSDHEPIVIQVVGRATQRSKACQAVRASSWAVQGTASLAPWLTGLGLRFRAFRLTLTSHCARPASLSSAAVRPWLPVTQSLRPLVLTVTAWLGSWNLKLELGTSRLPWQSVQLEVHWQLVTIWTCQCLDNSSICCNRFQYETSALRVRVTVRVSESYWIKGTVLDKPSQTSLHPRIKIAFKLQQCNIIVKNKNIIPHCMNRTVQVLYCIEHG